MGRRRAAEATAEVDRMIAAFATARTPKALAAWADRQTRLAPADDAAKRAASMRAIARLGRLFPGSVKVS